MSDQQIAERLRNLEALANPQENPYLAPDLKKKLEKIHEEEGK